MVEADTREEVLDELRDATRFVLVTHENPDGDALGSLLGLHRVLTQLGKDSVMFLAAKEFPLPVEYRFLPLTDVFHIVDGSTRERVPSPAGQAVPNAPGVCPHLDQHPVQRSILCPFGFWGLAHVLEIPPHIGDRPGLPHVVYDTNAPLATLVGSNSLRRAGQCLTA
jgi:hypothetical protein